VGLKSSQTSFSLYGDDVETMQRAAMGHGIIGVLFIAAVLAHIYVGTIGMEGAFEAMGEGSVDLNWAKEHHSLWLTELETKSERSSGQQQPAPGD
jgi:formate dehydrogenase subunit gamma